MKGYLPLILLGGAAVMLAGGKKKKKAPSVPSFGELKLEPTTPPPLPKSVKKSGSGYPGVSRDRMQEIQTMLVANGYDVGSYGLDGKYGPATKAAVLAFQKDHMPKSDGWDGKPGPKTQAALEQVEQARLQGQQQKAQQQPEKKAQIVDECDPLNPATWGSGNICVFDGVKWARRKAQVAKTPKPKAPKPEPALTCSPGWIESWDIENGGVCIRDNVRIYLSEWLPENMKVETSEATTGWIKGGRSVGGLDFPRLDISIKSRSHLAKLLPSIKSMAVSYPELNFSVAYWSTSKGVTISWRDTNWLGYYRSVTYDRWLSAIKTSGDMTDFIHEVIQKGPEEAKVQ